MYRIPSSFQGINALLIILSEENVNSCSIHASMDIIVRGYTEMVYNFLCQFRHYTEEQMIWIRCSCDHMSGMQCHPQDRKQDWSSLLHSIFSCQILNVCLLRCDAWRTCFSFSWLIFSRFYWPSALWYLKNFIVVSLWDIKSMYSHLGTPYMQDLIHTSDRNCWCTALNLSHLFFLTVLCPRSFPSILLMNIYLLCHLTSCLEKGFILMGHVPKWACA